MLRRRNEEDNLLNYYNDALNWIYLTLLDKSSPQIFYGSLMNANTLLAKSPIHKLGHSSDGIQGFCHKQRPRIFPATAL